MSNPAVIVLDNASDKKSKFKRFVVEDNIGESLHLHVNEMRFDFTVDDYLVFASLAREALGGLDFLCGYSVENFDESFLKDCAKFIANLESIEIETKTLRDLKCIHRYVAFGGLHLTRLVKVVDTAAYRFLKGQDDSFISYPQFNHVNENNEDRLRSIVESVKECYPKDDRYIVLFDGEDVIRDGQHRAAALADIYGLDFEVEVMRFHFKGRPPKVRTHLTNVYKIGYWLLRKIYHRYFVR